MVHTAAATAARRASHFTQVRRGAGQRRILTEAVLRVLASGARLSVAAQRGGSGGSCGAQPSTRGCTVQLFSGRFCATHTGNCAGVNDAI